MRLAIVAYPSLDGTDRQWIESFRVEHDPQASRIDAHFTLVFPIEGVPGDLGPEVDIVARSADPITFTIRGTTVVRDSLGDDHHIFLVPEDGNSQIAMLHSRLYAGSLRDHLRSDVLFVPHITVGATGDSQTAERLAKTLEIRSRGVRGTVAHLDLIDLGPSRVQTLATYPLGGAT